MTELAAPPPSTFDETLERFPMQDLNLSVAEDDDDGALQAIASLACAFRHPARLAHINGIAAAARKAGFDASVRAFKDVVQALPNAPEPEVRSAFISQLAQLAAAWDEDGGAQGHAEVVKLMYTALDALEDDVEEVSSAGQAAVLAIAPLLTDAELAADVLITLDSLGQHPEDEVRCILAELVASLAADVDSTLVEADLLPRLLRLATDTAYLVRKEAVFGLPKIAPRISAELLESRLVPAFRALAADRVWLVRAAAAAALPAVAGTLPAGEARAALVDVWRSLVADNSKWVVSSALTSLGPFLALLTPDSITDGLVQELHRAIDEGAAGEGCLAAAAAAFPAVAEAAGAGRWATLKPVLQALVLSGDQQVIHGLARDLPRLARLLGPTRAASDWLPALEDMQRLGGGAAESGLAAQLAEFAALVPPERRAAVVQPLVAALRGSASWRMRCELAGQLALLARSLPVEVVAEELVPAALQLCADPVAAVRHAAAAECAATAAQLHRLLGAGRRPSASTDPSTTSSTAPTGDGCASIADSSSTPPPSPAASGAPEMAEAGGKSSLGNPDITHANHAEGLQEGQGSSPSTAEVEAANQERRAMPTDEPPSEGGRAQEGSLFASLLRQLKSELAHSRSYRARHSFVLVCSNVLGLGALELFEQELLPELLQLAQDPIVNVRLAVCRLLLQDRGPFGSPGSPLTDRADQPKPALRSQPAFAPADTHMAASKDNNDPKAASSVRPTVPAAASREGMSGEGQEQRSTSAPSSSSYPPEESGTAAGSESVSQAQASQSSIQQGSASQEELLHRREMLNVTAWLLKSPDVMKALKVLASDVDPEVRKTAERCMGEDKAA